MNSIFVFKRYGMRGRLTGSISFMGHWVRHGQHFATEQCRRQALFLAKQTLEELRATPKPKLPG